MISKFGILISSQVETRKEGLLPALVMVVVVVVGGSGLLVCGEDGMGQTWKGCP